MSLSSVFDIGRSALTAGQLGIAVTGNNLANVATRGYTRQLLDLSPAAGSRLSSSTYLGRGVSVTGVRRQIDAALQARLWSGTSDFAGAQWQASIASQIETTVGGLSDKNLASNLTTFFNAWSEKSNQSLSSGLVVQQGEALASYIRTLRSDLVEQRTQIDRQLGQAAVAADELLARIADLNSQVSAAEGGGGVASSLRDQRDQLITRLSELMDVTAVEQPGGMVDLLVHSTPVLLNGLSRGVELVRRTGDDGSTEVYIGVKASGERLDIRSGQLGASLDGRAASVDATIEQLDAVATQLIFQLNRLHSTGANLKNPTASTGTLSIGTGHRTLAINDPANTTFADLPFQAVNGGFLVQVKQTATGSTQTVRINVDLDGITASGAAGTADDTTPEQIRAALDAVPGLTATFDAEGRLDVRADDGFEFSFADDSSGVLAVLGMNAYFTGTGARDIGVRQDLLADPSLLLTGRLVGGSFVENGTASQVVSLQDVPLAALAGRSVRSAWSDAVQVVGLTAQAASDRAVSTGIVKDSLEAQRAAVSGVSTDEEAVNLISYQQQYQGAARLISIAQEMTQTLMALV